jgi:hypothetical protein
LIKTAIAANRVNADVGIGNLLIQYKDHQVLVESRYLEGLRSNGIATFVQYPGFTRFVFKSEEFKSVEFPRIRMAEDQVYLARTNFLDRNIYLSNLILYKYYSEFPNQATTNKNSLKELPDSLPLIYTLKNLGSQKTNQLIWMLLLKLSLTCLSRGIGIRTALRYVIVTVISKPEILFSIFMSWVRIKIAKK